MSIDELFAICSGVAVVVVGVMMIFDFVWESKSVFESVDKSMFFAVVVIVEIIFVSLFWGDIVVNVVGAVVWICEIVKVDNKWVEMNDVIEENIDVTEFDVDENVVVADEDGGVIGAGVHITSHWADVPVQHWAGQLESKHDESISFFDYEKKIKLNKLISK